MSQETTPGIPAKVQQIVEEVRRFLEPELHVINERHWQITFTTPAAGPVTEEVHMILDIRRTTGGRITNPTVTANGVRLNRGWRELVSDVHKDSSGPTDVPDIEERPIDGAPSQVRRQYESFTRALGQSTQGDGIRIRIGREGDLWVVGVDSRVCDCEKLICQHNFAIRVYFRRKGGTWRADNNRFLAVIRGMDVSSQWRGQADKIITMLAGETPDVSAAPDHSPPSGASSPPATTANSVVTRKTTAIRN